MTQEILTGQDCPVKFRTFVGTLIFLYLSFLIFIIYLVIKSDPLKGQCNESFVSHSVTPVTPFSNNSVTPESQIAPQIGPKASKRLGTLNGFRLIYSDDEVARDGFISSRN